MILTKKGKGPHKNISAALLDYPHVFVLPLGCTVLYNLPFWIKISAHIGYSNLPAIDTDGWNDILAIKTLLGTHYYKYYNR